ncbi:MAG: hypothetical protein GQ544_04445 [Candidatus Aminicenantes bacterium]|jgi:hypothetical protein|nr:hypothetical protein [Candidatus Aminicenantes bacterium]
MLVKIKLRPFLGISLVVLLLATVYLLRLQEYRLNRTVRNVALRLVQVETLSRTTRVDYRLVFWNNICRVDVFDRNSNRWKPYADTAYCKGVLSQPVGLEVVFSQGRFKEYRLGEGRGKSPKYLIIEFFVVGTEKKRGIIFYQDGNWRVLS